MSLTRIEFVNVMDLTDFFAQLEGQLELDYPMGNGLDAVYDVLSNDLTGPAEIIWHDSGISRTALGDAYVRLVDVLNIVANERDDLTVSYE